MQRRTRIVATLGPATDRSGVLEKLIESGLDVARINFSHGDAGSHHARIQALRQLAKQHNRNVAILGDLPGPKLRAMLKDSLTLATGKAVTLAIVTGATADIQLTEPEALAMAKPGERVLFDDGRLQGRVEKVTKDTVTLTIDAGGTLLPNKGINLPDTELNIPAVTQRDREAIAVALKFGVDWLALSFVRSASAGEELRAVIRGHGGNVPILAKIERPEAVRHAAAIIEAFDGIMVARGDLGVEIALEKVPHVQKQLIQQARIAGKPVITATDMLDSMRKNPRPTRAEVSDVANAVYDGTDAVMLSGETAVGDYPIETIGCMNNIVQEAESHLRDGGTRRVPIPRGDLIDCMTHDVCDLVHETSADAIITPTISGRTARLVARHRPRANIVGASTDPSIVRQLAVVWGVTAVEMQAVPPGGNRLDAAVRAAFESGAIKAGSLVVVLARHAIEGGEGFPSLRVARVGPDGRSCEP